MAYGFSWELAASRNKKRAAINDDALVLPHGLVGMAEHKHMLGGHIRVSHDYLSEPRNR